MRQPKFNVGDKVFIKQFAEDGIVVSITELDDTSVPTIVYGTLIYRVYIPEWSQIIDGLLEKLLEEPSRESER